MSDIFTKLYLNIGKFKYPDQMRIEPEDIILFEKSLQKMIVNPTLFLIVTITFSRLRPKMLRSMKEFFYKNRRESIKKQLIEDMNDKFSQISLKNSDKLAESNKNILQTITNNTNNKEKYNNDLIEEEYDDTDNHLFNQGASALKINTSRKLKARKGDVKENEEEVLNIPRKEPMFREEFFSFGKSTKAKSSRLLFFKKYLNRKVDSKNFNAKALDYLVNSKFVYVPFFIFTFLTLFDFGYTTLGLYLKYQPLIDTYFSLKDQSML